MEFVPPGAELPGLSSRVVRPVGFGLSRPLGRIRSLQRVVCYTSFIRSSASLREPLICWCLASVAFILVGHDIFNCFADTQ